MQVQTQHQAQAVAELRAALFAMQDENYRDFHAKLIPNVDKETIIGVRVPRMRAYAKALWKQAPETARAFLEALPHGYYEENCLHGLLIDTLAETTGEALRLIDRFLPYIDNWATCDMLPPKIFASDLARVRETVLPWLASEETYRDRDAADVFPGGGNLCADGPCAVGGDPQRGILCQHGDRMVLQLCADQAV